MNSEIHICIPSTGKNFHTDQKPTNQPSNHPSNSGLGDAQVFPGCHRTIGRVHSASLQALHSETDRMSMLTFNTY